MRYIVFIFATMSMGWNFMSDKMDILDLFFTAAERMVAEKDVMVSGLIQTPVSGFCGLFQDTESFFTVTRLDKYSEVITHSKRTGKYHYLFSNELSNPRPGQEKMVKLVTSDPGLIARRLTQYKVA